MAEMIGPRIDLRSDALTLPTQEMLAAMQTARLGWVFRGEDPNVNELEGLAATTTGMEDALYLPSGTMGNLVALMTHTSHGDQVIVESTAHVLCCEEWGLASICGVLARPIEGNYGAIDADQLDDALKHAPFRHTPRTSLICIENTHNASAGAAIATSEIRKVCEVATRYDVAVHLDGARIFNAAAAVNEPVANLLTGVASVTFNLNKGLSAPEGALLCGTKEFIRRARVHRSRVGGLVGKSGISAAAGLVALRTMIPQVAEDNRRASLLADGLERVQGLRVLRPPHLSNIVMARTPSQVGADRLRSELANRGIGSHVYGSDVVRFVTHRHIADEHVREVIESVRDTLESMGAA